MGGIRKKTSKRGTTFQGFKIKKKAAETRKKNARSARKDVTWKSSACWSAFLGDSHVP
jgi:nuclear GTP-binding protein